ncbi:unnamed protein product [Rhizophagus irregularis]|nr:unnamed protein product [Rhizophagus irregularis]CAB5385637.1 unnamed protein product [Rhizophagus irregularis]
MLERAIKLQEPLNDIIGLERDLNEFLILEDEWNILRELCHIFKMFYDASLYMSNSQFVTLSSSIPIYNSLLEHLKKLLDENNKKYYCKSLEVRLAITKGYEKLKTYYSKTDDSHTYAIAIIIDPQFKLSYYQKQKWEQHYIDATKQIFTDTFKNNYQDNIDIINESENTINNDNDFFFNIFGSNGNNNDYNEIEAYLQQPAASIKTNPLQWWKTNEPIYLRLANMARDYLAIPGKHLIFFR